MAENHVQTGTANIRKSNFRLMRYGDHVTYDLTSLMLTQPRYFRFLDYSLLYLVIIVRSGIVFISIQSYVNVNII
jgi:hypothetical protein